MTTEEYENALEKLQKKYENNLVQIGRLISVNDDMFDRNKMLKRTIDKLTTCNKSLTTQLANIKRKLSVLVDTINCTNETLSRARDISPEVSARINEIMDEVEEAYYTKTHKKPSAV